MLFVLKLLLMVGNFKKLLSQLPSSVSEQNPSFLSHIQGNEYLLAYKNSAKKVNWPSIEGNTSYVLSSIDLKGSLFWAHEPSNYTEFYEIKLDNLTISTKVVFQIDDSNFKVSLTVISASTKKAHLYVVNHAQGCGFFYSQDLQVYNNSISKSCDGKSFQNYDLVFLRDNFTIALFLEVGDDKKPKDIVVHLKRGSEEKLIEKSINIKKSNVTGSKSLVKYFFKNCYPFSKPQKEQEVFGIFVEYGTILKSYRIGFLSFASKELIERSSNDVFPFNPSETASYELQNKEIIIEHLVVLYYPYVIRILAITFVESNLLRIYYAPFHFTRRFKFFDPDCVFLSTQLYAYCTIDLAQSKIQIRHSFIVPENWLIFLVGQDKVLKFSVLKCFLFNDCFGCQAFAKHYNVRCSWNSFSEECFLNNSSRLVDQCLVVDGRASIRDSSTIQITLRGIKGKLKEPFITIRELDQGPPLKYIFLEENFLHLNYTRKSNRTELVLNISHNNLEYFEILTVPLEGLPSLKKGVFTFFSVIGLLLTAAFLTMLLFSIFLEVTAGNKKAEKIITLRQKKTRKKQRLIGIQKTLAGKNFGQNNS